MTTSRVRAAVAVLAALALVGCAAASSGETGVTGPVDDTPLAELVTLEDPRAHEGPSTATLVQRDVDPVTDDPAESLPATVVSHDRAGDVEVTVTDTSRVLAINMSGSLAATVWGLGFGDRLVGRDGSTTFPEALDLPVITKDGHAINAEAVLGLAPTVVVTDGSIGPRDVVEQLRDAGVTVVFVSDTPSFIGASDLAREVAAVFGAPEAGELLAQRVADQVAETVADIAAFAPRADDEKLSMLFLYLRGTSGVYYIFGRDSGASDLIEGLGGRDVAAELGWTDMRPLTDEAIVAANPDLILVMSGGLESTNGVDGLLAEKPAIAMTTAGEKRRFVDMADGDVLSFGPRSADVLAALARAVYAPSP